MTSKQPLRAILYAHSASKDQMAPAANVDAQIARLRGYAEEHGLIVVDEVVDAGSSGNRLDRPGMLVVLNLASKSPRAYDVLLVTERSRIARNMSAYSIIVDKLAMAGVRVEAPSDRSPCFLTERIMQLYDDYNRAHRSKTTSERRLEVARSGNWPDHLPFGYRREKREAETASIVPHDPEASIVRLAFGLARSGHSQAATARQLNALGHRQRNSGRWTNGSVGRILRNGAYYGKGVVRAPVDTTKIGESIVGIAVPFPPLISRNEFYEVQRLLRSRRR